MSAELLVALVATLTIIISRITVALVWRFKIHAKVEPRVAGIKIHHITYGIVLLVLHGYFVSIRGESNNGLIVMFGVGLGLLIDELLPALSILSKYWFIKGSGGEEYHSQKGLIFVATSLLTLLMIGIVQ